ncbi:NIPSNAP protein [Prosthecobacter fusiformis]|uniref:NIPSNAP protein n=1 Tax=Prosthecobacter fusiformis TaxID=48464 RepID=A0A4V6Q5D8_9BACT|nr:NIPSNAP family protein [Prosthecobacter fusiformis]TDU70623.1 NIPSNAP protein [Prosthecobacter fusiformis]
MTYYFTSIPTMTRRHILPIVSSILLACTATAAETAPAEVYELRVYTANEGKLDTLLARFRDHTCRLFEKHGITNIGYWVPINKEDGADTTLIYILKHKSIEGAKEAFAAFGKDPEWQAARKASEENGKILAKPPESLFLSTTDYSPPVKTGVGDGERVFELRTYTTHPGKLDALHSRFKNHTMKLFSKHGMSHVAYWTPAPEQKDAGIKLIYILSHASPEAGLASFTAFRADPVWIAAKGESEKDGSLTIPQPDGVKSVYMRATDFSPIR